MKSMSERFPDGCLSCERDDNQKLESVARTIFEFVKLDEKTNNKFIKY